MMRVFIFFVLRCSAPCISTFIQSVIFAARLSCALNLKRDSDRTAILGTNLERIVYLVLLLEYV